MRGSNGNGFPIMFTAKLPPSLRLGRGPANRHRRLEVLAQAHGQAMLIDCQRHGRWWTGVVKIRESSRDRVVHVCSELRTSSHDALGDAEHDAQRLALMFVQ